MKKYILCFLTVIFALGQMDQLNAQYRTYPEPILEDYDARDGAGLGPGEEDAVVDRYGNPSCCESGGFSHTLSFSSFANLLALENKILRTQWAEVKRWLDKQEETFRKEINRQMGKNYSSFAEAQREFFKFYDGGRYGNSGVVARANTLRSDNSRWASQNKQRAYDNIMKHHIIDEWIECGYCSELQGLAYEQGGLAKYDHDSSPGPRFYAAGERDASRGSFEKNRYDYLLNNTRKIGLGKMLEDGFLLNELSQWRINDYRNRGVKESVFLMSAYLISSSTYCPLVQSNCLPSQLQKYAPQRIGNDILYAWAEELAPEIYGDFVLFTEDYPKLSSTYYRNRFYPNRWWTYQNNISLARDYVKKDLERIEEENKICGGIKWTDLETSESFYTNLTGLRLIGSRRLLPWSKRSFPIADICIQIPNFNVVDDRDVKIPSHIATTRLRIAWEAAVNSLEMYEPFRAYLEKKDPDPAELTTIMVANLNVMLNEQRFGSTAIAGRCPGVTTSRVMFCR